MCYNLISKKEQQIGKFVLVNERKNLEKKMQDTSLQKTISTKDALDWIDSWVSNPVSSYSPAALEMLFAQTKVIISNCQQISRNDILEEAALEVDSFKGGAGWNDSKNYWATEIAESIRYLKEKM